MKTCIVLAGGKAQRFSGTVKELLPISKEESVIDNSINAARVWAADRIIIISNPDKINYHVRYFSQDKYEDLNISYKVQYSGEMWHALQLGLQDATDDNLVVMADTVFSYNNLPAVYKSPLVFGTFLTSSPAEYSVFVDGKIKTKDKSLMGTYPAWGCVQFTKEVVEHWNNCFYLHYDEAFNDAMRVFKHSTFSVGDFHDIGTIGRYVEYLSKHYV